MTEEHARKIVHELLHNVQKARSDINEVWDGWDAGGWDPETTEMAKAELHRWLMGRQGDGFVLLLADLDSGAKPLEPMTLYNLMYITHHLEPTIGMVATLRGWDLPQPDLQWLRGFEEGN